MSRLGTAVITRDELAASLAIEADAAPHDDGQLLDLNQAVAARWAWHAEKLTVGFANPALAMALIAKHRVKVVLLSDQ